MAMNDVIARLSVQLGLDTGQFSTGVGKTKAEMTGLERHVSRAGAAIKTVFVGMLGAFAVGQIADLAKRGLDYASSLGEVAAQLGVTTRALQEYRYAASQAGIEQGEMDQALAQLTRRLGDAANGAKEPAGALARLGISVRDANGQVRDAGETIPLIAEALKGISSPAERAALLVDLFGKSGQKLAPLLAGGAAGVNSLRDAAQKLGIVLSDSQINKADEAADKLTALKQVMEARIAGAAADNVDSILALVDGLTALIVAAGGAAKAIQDFIRQGRTAAPTIAEMRLKDPGATDSLFNIRPAGPPKGGTRVEKLFDRMMTDAQADKRQRANDRAFSGASLPPKRNPWAGAAPGLLQRRNAAGTSSFGGMDLSRFELGAGQANWIKAAANDYSAMAMAAGDLESRNRAALATLAEMAGVQSPRLLANIQKMTPAMDALRMTAQGILDRLFPDAAETRRFGEELATLTAAMDQGQLSTDDYKRAVTALRQEFNGFAAELAANAQVISQGIGPSIEQLAQDATDRFQDFAEGLGTDAGTAKVQVVKSFQDMASETLGALDRLAGGIRGGGFLDILSGILGLGLQLGGLGLFGKGVANNIKGIPGHANGIGWSHGGLAMVGERGPELVSLPKGARVTPNNQLGRMRGGIAEIVPSPYFNVVVDGRVAAASPAIMDGSARVTAARAQRRSGRRLA